MLHQLLTADKYIISSRIVS